MIDNREMVERVAVAGPAAGPFLVEKADHAMGLELQIVEVVEQQARARVQHRDGDAEGYEPELTRLRLELAATVDGTSSRF